MSKIKIGFFKSLSLLNRSFAIKVLNDPKYDNNSLVNKDAIREAVSKYRDKLDFLDTEYSPTIPKLDKNIEGHYLAQNIPEIPSVVIDEVCNKEILRKIVDKHDITHIALSTYATGLDKTIELIKTIQSDFPDKKLFIGGVGSVYPHIQELVHPKDLCIGNGLNWLREKFDLNLISNDKIRIPFILGRFHGFPVKVKTAFMVTQIGCPINCNFCITTNFLKHIPFSNPKKIIDFIENLSLKSRKDTYLFINEPNAFFPEVTWKKVFSHFIENPRKIESNIFIVFEGSLNHINKFELEKIQNKSPIKFLFISYGIESTLKGGYAKNQGDPKAIIRRLNNLGIFTAHNYILGLPFHTKETIDLEISNNLNFGSDLVSFNSFKPIPHTPLYNQLKSENRLHDRTLPPEFLYSVGFLPFDHKYIGGGFEILKYLFDATYRSDQINMDQFDNFANKLFDIYAITNSRKIMRAAKIFMRISKLKLYSFEERMPAKFISLYRENIKKTRLRYKKLKN
ncbi:MAG: B12-binding domain-containing radical SAM protein [Promethearchaeota archaeon]|jgi:hypothetical protein